MAGKAQINIEVGIQQAQSAIADLEAQIAGFKAQMDEISGAMFQTRDQRAGAFAGMSYDQLTEQFGQVQQQYMAAQEQLQELQGVQEEVAQTAQAAGAAQVEAAQKANEAVLQLKDGMTALGSVSRKSLDAEPVIVYGEAAQRASSQVVGMAEQAASASSRVVRATQQANIAQGESVDIVEGLREQYAALAAEVEKFQGMSFLTPEEAAGLEMDRQMMADISAEAVTYGAVMEDSSAKASRGISGTITEFRQFRSLMSATIGIAALGFYITEWQNIYNWINNATQALAGYDAERKAVESDAQSASNKALTTWGKLPAELQLSLAAMQDAPARTEATLQAEISSTQQQLAGLRQQRKEIEDLIAKQQELHDLQAKMRSEAVPGVPSPFSGADLQRQAQLVDQIKGLQRALGASITNDLGKALANIKSQLSAGGDALTQFQVQLKELPDPATKASAALQKADGAIGSLKVQVPGLVTSMDHLKQALMFPDMKENQNLFAYAELNAQRLQEGLAPLSATLQQLGIELPKLTMPTIPAGLLSLPAGAIATWHEWVMVVKDGRQQLEYVVHPVEALSAAQRAALPTARELQVAIEQLTKTYPQLTHAEIENLAQVRLQDPAFRQAIDNSSRMTKALHDQGIGWSQLSMQVRTAVSQMTGELTGWGGVASRVFDQMFNAVSKQIEIEQKQAGATQLSASLTAKASLDGLKQLAPVKAIMYTAEGFGHLAAFQYAQATEDFAAAALWGTVGAFQIASMAGAFNPGSGGSTASAVATAATSSSTSSGASPALASGAASAAAANGGSQQHTIQVIFQGPVYGGKAATSEIIDNINAAVTFDRKQLKASHTITGKAIRA